MKEEKKKQIRDIMGDLKYLDKESLPSKEEWHQKRNEGSRQEYGL